jgi:hypothetical protein
MSRPLLILLLALALAGCAYGKHINAGDALYAKGDYEQAIVEYQSALKLDPDSEEAKAKLADARRRLGERYEQEARDLLKRGDHVGAITAAARAQEHAEVAPSVLNLARDVSRACQDHADQLAQQRDWAQALKITDALYAAFPEDRPLLDERIGALRADWARSLSERAAASEQAQHHGDALLLYAQAAELTQRPEHIAKRDELYAMLVDTQSYNVRVVSLSGNAGSRAVSSNITSPQSQRLIRVLDDKLIKRGKKPHVTYKIQIGSPDFDTERTSSTRTTRYKSGTRPVPNPAYQSALRDVEHAEREVQRYQNEIYRLENDLARYQQQVAREGDTPGTSTGAEQGVSRTQSSLGYTRDNLRRAQDAVLSKREYLNRTPQTIEEDVYSDLQYTVTTHRLTGAADVVLLIEHADGRPPLALQRMVTIQVSDEEHSSQPLANIPADPLNLPDRTSLSDDLWRVGAQLAQGLLVQSLDAHRALLLEQAFKASEEGLRVHYFVLYILLDPSSVDPKIVEEIAQSRGIPDAPRILLAR